MSKLNAIFTSAELPGDAILGDFFGDPLIGDWLVPVCAASTIEGGSLLRQEGPVAPVAPSTTPE